MSAVFKDRRDQATFRKKAENKNRFDDRKLRNG